jgi:superfamily II DNA helicase RecQ
VGSPAHLRRKLAEEHSVPPYVIFPDSTLLEMLRSQPVSLSDMAQVSGVGARKLERYGQAFLEVLGARRHRRRRRWCSTCATNWSAWPAPA